MISLSKRDFYFFLNLYLLSNLDAPSPILCVRMCEGGKKKTQPAFFFRGWLPCLLAALSLSFTVPGEFDHVVLLLLLLLGEHLLLGF